MKARVLLSVAAIAVMVTASVAAPKVSLKGVKCVINTDAHRNEHAGFLRLGTGIARKGWLTADDVINTLPLPKLRKELAKKRNKN